MHGILGKADSNPLLLIVTLATTYKLNLIDRSKKEQIESNHNKLSYKQSNQHGNSWASHSAP